MNIDTIRKVDIIIGKPIIQLLRPFKKKKKKPKIITQILLTKFFGFGNLIMISPTIEQIKKTYPNAEIDFLTLKNNKPIIENYDHLINRFFFFDTTNILRIIPNTLKLIYTLNKRNYDLIIDFDQFARYSAILSFLAAPKYSIGFKTIGQGRDHLLDKIIPYNGNLHAAENFNSLVTKGLGFDKPKKLISVEPRLKKENITKRDKFLEKNRIKDYIIVHGGMGENARVRKWSNDYFAELINMILDNQKYKDLRIVLTASPAEKQDLDMIIKKIKKEHKARWASAYGQKLEIMPPLIKKAKLVITSDTGILHVAASLKKMIIAPFGPTTPQEYGPLCKEKILFYKNFQCSPCITNENCKKATCKDNRCMKAITPKEMHDAFVSVKI
jgi:heptosyltransferase III